jgi:hypothetical protein
MNPRHASAHARRLGRTRSPEMALVREPDAEPCPRRGRAVATIWTASGPARVDVPEGKLPRLVEARPHRCGDRGVT